MSVVWIKVVSLNLAAHVGCERRSGFVSADCSRILVCIVDDCLRETKRNLAPCFFWTWFWQCIDQCECGCFVSYEGVGCNIAISQFAIEADQDSRVIFFGVDREICFWNIERTFADNAYDLAACCSARTIPGDEAADCVDCAIFVFASSSMYVASSIAMNSPMI